MSQFSGTITVPGVINHPIAVTIDLRPNRIRIVAGHDDETAQIGFWSVGEVVFRGRDDGFDVIVNGFAGHLRTENDGLFALEVGLRSAPSRLRRLMSMERDRIAV